jgi:pyruvate kinase
MVARGDLGIETSLTDLPNIQRRIMYACAKWGRRSIVATHLLESMIENPTPTRAEVTDIANAIYEGADAIMLSGETSVGKYPSECVTFLKSIAEKTEKFRTLGYEKNFTPSSDWQHIGVAAKNLAETINADGIIAITRTGKTANYISNSKPNGIPVFTFTGNKKTLNQLSLIGSTVPFYLSNLSNHQKTLTNVSKILKKYYGKDKKDLKFIMVSSIFSEEHSEAIQIINI